MDAILSNIQENFSFLISEMNDQHYDKIRFASYRTACKIHFIQKKTNLYLIDLFSAIEIIRENDLHKIQDINSEITMHQLYQMAQLLFLQLNKRLPRTQNVDITSSITNLLSFMIFANDLNQSGKINVLFTKIVFCTLSSGKFQEKLKYIFSQIIDPATGNMMMIKFCAFIKSLLQLACTVNESQFYQYDEQVAKTIFHTALLPSLDLKSFIRLFYSQNGPPPILSWFVILHKMAQVEFVIHPTICSGCSAANFTGFRYKCLKCYNTNLCQNCFWTGKSTNSHNAEKHSCKEYLNYKSPSKQLSNSIRRSFRLKPPPKNKIEINDDFFRTSDSPNYDVNSPNSLFNQLQDFDAISDYTYENMEGSLDGTNQFEVLPGNQSCFPNECNPRIINKLTADPQSQYVIIENPQDIAWSSEQPVHFAADLNFGLDDEHRLISMYAASLANSNSPSIVDGFDQFGNPVAHSVTVDSHLSDQLGEIYFNQQLAEYALDYENKNRELMMEIMKLRGCVRDVSPSSDYNSLVNSVSNNLRSLSGFSNSPVLSIKSLQDAVAIEELCYLQEKKNELENHLQTLLMSKEELKNQLQNTIKMTENFQNLCSTPSSVNSTLKKTETFALQKDLNKLQKSAVKRDQLFEEIEDLLEKEILQSHQNELDEEINKVQQAEQKLQEGKELLEDFDRILSVEQTASRLMSEKQNSPANKFTTNSKNLGTNDEVASNDSLTLHEELLSSKPSDQYDQANCGPTNGELQCNGDKLSTLEANNKSIFGLAEGQKTIGNSCKTQNGSTSQTENVNQIEFNEETIHNNILKRNIELLLRQNTKQSTGQQPKTKRINKYELVYGRRDKSSDCSNNQINPNQVDLLGQHSASQIKTTNDANRLSKAGSLDSVGDKPFCSQNTTSQFDKKTNQNSDAKREFRLLNDNSIEEISEANNSQTNSISSSSYLKFDVKGQSLMSFQSIAYVQANRLLNSNPPHPNAQTSSLSKLMNMGGSNTSSDLPTYKMGDSLDDSSLDTVRIPDMGNLSSTSSNTESVKSSDTDDCLTLVDELNNVTFD